MEEAGYEEEKGNIKDKKRKRGNDHPNYKKGARKAIMGVLLYAGVLPTKVLPLIDWNERTLAEKARFMRREGILVKEKIGKEMAYRIARLPQDDKELHELSSTFPKRYIDYINNKTELLQRIKGQTWKGDPMRMIRNAGAIAFMDRLPVAYAPEDKREIMEPIEGNVFYSSVEMRQNGMPENRPDEYSYKTGYTRSNGVLFAAGGTYVIYNYSNNLLQFHKSRELIVRELAMRTALKPASAMVLYGSDEILKEMVLREKYYASTQNVLDETYDAVYALPLSREGQELASIMCVQGWEKFMRTLYKTEKNWNDNAASVEQMLSDGMVPVNVGGKVSYKYTFDFMIPDIRGLKFFWEYVKTSEHPERFVIRCFDFQLDAIRMITERRVRLLIYKFDLFKRNEKVYRSSL